jgi:methylamine dehydrogenase heavy chain
MRSITLRAICLGLIAHAANAQIVPEQVTVETMADPTPRWVMITGNLDSTAIFGGDPLGQKGNLATSSFTPAMQPNPAKGELYASESHFSRTYRGDRTDILAAYDVKTLMPKWEVSIPNKTVALAMRHHIGMTGNSRHVAILNMTPGQSLSIIDVVDQEFDGEISTPGCAMIMPVGDNDILMICGDGTLQLIQLDNNGQEANRVRSDSFFGIDDDPVFDHPVKSADGWLLMSHQGKMFNVTVSGSTVNIPTPWSMVTDEEDIEAEWRVGGFQPMTLHRDSGLVYALMHQGGVDTHHEAGTELWVFNQNSGQRVFRLPLEIPIDRVFVTQDGEPRLYMTTEEGTLQVRDAHELTILQEVPRVSGMMQSFGTYD